MSSKTSNRIHVFYNAAHPPYVYGAVQIIDGDVKNLRRERPFVMSKRRSNGQEVVYGTVSRILEKISSQVRRLDDFRSKTRRELSRAGITPSDPEASMLPESAISDRILDEQDDLIEEVLQSVSVHLRILSEVLPSNFEKRKVTVYDYDDRAVDKIRLDRVSDLLLHNRYILVRSPYVVDLISDKQFMSSKPQMGLKIDFTEYIVEAGRLVDGITVKDLVGKLWGMTKALSASSSIRDIVFLLQNLYTLGGSVLGTDAPVDAGPLKTILDRAATEHIHSRRQRSTGHGRTKVRVQLTFTTPRFYLQPDLDNKQIRVATKINGRPETLVMGYEEFFSEVVGASGNRKLHTAAPM